MAVVVTSSILSVFLQQFEGFDVEVHPPNQSGASSREVFDIDIKCYDQLFAAFEVKDKNFSEQDVDHAAFKARQYGLKNLTFVTGLNANPVGSTYKQIAKTVSSRGVNVIFVRVEALARAVLALRPNLTTFEFINVLQTQARAARVKDEFFSHAKEVIDAKVQLEQP